MIVNDTICAPATAVGEAGITIIRISGEGALMTAKKVFFKNGDSDLYEPRKMYLGSLVFDGSAFDTALGVFFKAPFSYTGEDVFELHCHGGRVITEMAMQALIKNGARIAEPGEFTKRAFLNGKLDITQAEAVCESISALTESGVKMSAKRLRGDLREKIDTLKERLTDVIASIEAGIEYPEEEEEISAAAASLPDIFSVKREAEELLKTYDMGRIVREGMEIAIAGRPNVGKSSLLNAILGEDKAIVTSVPGTTRDTISEYYDLHGIPVRFTDTAGIRESEDIVEQIGVERSRAALDEAYLVLFLIDAQLGITDEDRALYESIKDKRHIVVVNKCDVAESNSAASEFSDGCFIISAKTGEGISALLTGIAECCGLDDATRFEGVAITNLRQKTALQTAVKALTDAYTALDGGIDLDCVSIDLADAWRALCEITGEALTEDIVDRIFEKFCLGK